MSRLSNWLPSRRTRRATRLSTSRPDTKFARAGLRTERLEDRTMPATFAVTTLADSGIGSLRQAILDANGTAGSDTIRFDVAGTINVLSALPNISDTSGGTTIDGRTAPGYSSVPVVVLHGPGSTTGVTGLTIKSSNNRVWGLQIDSFAIGIDINGVVTTGVNGNIVAANYIGTNGSAAVRNATGVMIQGLGSGNLVGGVTAADRNVISGNSTGINLSSSNAKNNTIQGNYIGTNAAGTGAIANTTFGIYLNGSVNNTIGGDATGAGNLISGNGVGVYCDFASNGQQIVNNLIGTRADGVTALGNTGNGVQLFLCSNNQVRGNTIAFNNGSGVVVSSNASAGGNLIRSNTIFSNNRLGIDLSVAGDPSNGVTPNDAGDADTGPNGLQNYPVLTSVAAAPGGGTIVTGTLNSVANRTYTIEFFASPTADPSTFGEGAQSLGLITVTTDAAGNAVFSTTLVAGVSAGSVVTATATDPSNNTSEFSQRFVVNGNPNITVSDMALNESNSGTTANFSVNLSAAGTSTLTVNYATANGSALAGSDYQATSGMLTFLPGEMSKSVAVAINGDTTYERNEQFYLNLSGAVNGTISDGQAVAMINNDDVAPSVSVNDVQVAMPASGTTSAVFTISLSQPSGVTAQVSYATANGTAIAGTDYVAASGQATILAGETTASVSVTILGGQSYVGSRTFSLNLSSPLDATIADGVGTGTIVAVPNNDPPVAADDDATTDEDTPVTVGVLANDNDPDGDTLTVTAVTQGAHGSVVINANGSLTYTPAANYNGGDEFSYTIGDGNGGTDTAMVSVVVSPVNDGPGAVNDAATTDEDVAVTVTVLGNDTDVDGDALAVTAVTQGAHGSVAVNEDGTVTYTPAPNYFGGDSFTYTISDGNGGTAVGTVAVTVNPVGDPPAANDDAVTTNEDKSVTINVTANDAGDGLLRVVGFTQPAHGFVVLTAIDSVRYSPAFNFNGSDSFTYTIEDLFGGTATATVFVTVNPVNDAPIAGGNLAETLEDTPVTIEVLANDFDFDGDTITVVGVTQAAHGSVVMNENGTLTYTPAANFNGNDQFTYTASDGNGGTTMAAVFVTVDAVNDMPAAGDDNATTDEDAGVNISVLDNDTDVDGNPLAVSEVTQGAHGSVVINANGTVTYTPDANYFGSDSFSYTTSDGQGGSATASVSITINSVNDAPAITSGDLNLSAATINEAGSVSLSGSFADPETEQSHTVVINWGDGSANTTVNLAAGVFSFGSVSHSYADNGLFSITVSVTDSLGASGSAGTSITVNNLAPTAVVSGPTSAIPGQTRTFSFSASDPSTVDSLAGFQFTVNWGDGSSQNVSGVSPQSLDHAYATTGSFTVQVTATDKDGGISVAATHVITVSAIDLQQDPTDASKWAILVGGTAASDTITFRPGSAAGQVVAQLQSGGTTTIGTFTPSGSGATFSVTVNGVTTVNRTVSAPATLGRLVAYGNAGDDDISVVKNGPAMLAIPAYIFGDGGNDNLDAGGSNANNVVVGGSGNDKLFGGAGRDILIGGVGEDVLRAGVGGDIMIGESTDYDSNIGALTALLAEWGRTDIGYNARVGHLQGLAGGLNGPYVLTNATVHNDAVSDDLFGGAGEDWFFARLTGTNPDRIKKQDAGETVTVL